MRSLKSTLLLLFTLVAASAGPLIFPAAQAGHGTMAESAKFVLLPSAAVLSLLGLWSSTSAPAIRQSIVWGGLAGAIATIGLEVVRLTGFYLGYMPGNLPRLMGVLLLDRFALGPSLPSDLAGWAYHFWNGASFGIIYALIFGASRRSVAVFYGLALGMGFLVSPVVLSMGVGYFGLGFSKGFPATVLLAHAVFGFLLGAITHWLLRGQPSVLATEWRLRRIHRAVRRELDAERSVR